MEKSTLFAAAAILLIIVSAVLSATSPIWFSVAIVVLFGAPHNWLEFRYFLSRLPSRVGPFRAFFAVSFSGLFFLCLTEIALMIMVDRNLLAGDLTRQLLFVWNELLIIWVISLAILRYGPGSRNVIGMSLLFGSILSIANALTAEVFSLALTYIHPIVGLWIFERELRRTRKAWLKSYYCSLITLPIAVCILVLAVDRTAYGTDYSHALTQLSGNIGGNIFKNASPAILLAVYSFLQMVHYGVWVIAMPLATKGWNRWNSERLPVLRNRLRLRKCLGIILAASVAVPVAFWLGFKIDYSHTMAIYVLLSTLHVLAEFPFMFWMCES